MPIGWLCTPRHPVDSVTSPSKSSKRQTCRSVPRQQSTTCNRASSNVATAEWEGLDAAAWQAQQSPAPMARPFLQAAHTHLAPPLPDQCAAQGLGKLISCSACEQASHKRTLPTRPATALASRAIKQREHTVSSLQAAHGLPEASICPGQDGALVQGPAPRFLPANLQERCCDCGYVTKHPISIHLDFIAARPASADGVRTGTPAAFRPLSADSSRVTIPAVVAGSAIWPYSSRNSPSLCSSGKVTADAAVGEPLQSPLSLLQQSFQASLVSVSGTAAKAADSSVSPGRAVPMKDVLVVRQLACPGNEQAASVPAAAARRTQEVQPKASLKEASQQTELCCGSEQAAAKEAAQEVQPHADQKEASQQTELSPESSFLQMLDLQPRTDIGPCEPAESNQLHQQQQSVSLLLGLQDAITHTIDSASCSGAHSAASQSQQADLRLSGSPEHPEGCSASVAEAMPLAVCVAATVGQAAAPIAAPRLKCSHQLTKAEEAVRKPQQLDELCQVRAIIADSLQRKQHGSQPASVSMLYNDVMSQSMLKGPSVTPAASASQSQALQPALCTTVAAAQDQAMLPEDTVKMLPAGDSMQECRHQQARLLSGTVQQPCLQTQTSAVTKSSSVCDSRFVQAPTEAEDVRALRQPQGEQQQQEQQVRMLLVRNEHKDASTCCTEDDSCLAQTEHRQVLSRVWAERQQWLAARRRSDRDSAKWALDESDGSGGDSEGSVSSESTLRPSSVGRCRVNSGRHIKVHLSSLGHGIDCIYVRFRHQSRPFTHVQTGRHVMWGCQSIGFDQ